MTRIAGLVVAVLALSGCWADATREACEDLIRDRLTKVSAADRDDLNARDLAHICPGASPAQRERAYADVLAE